MFQNRQQAGTLLAERLVDLLSEDADFSPQSTAVIALPRGGVPVAAEVALKLGCSIDVLVSKKIGAPDNPELAIGAVSSDGVVILDRQLPWLFGNTARYLEAQQEQKERLIQETRALEDYWVKAAGMTRRTDVSGRLIVLVDDGVATGMTTRAALSTLRSRKASKIILATPVIPLDTHSRLRQECDLLVALSIPWDFTAVGYYYRDFRQVEDAEVVEALKRVLAVRT